MRLTSSCVLTFMAIGLAGCGPGVAGPSVAVRPDTAPTEPSALEQTLIDLTTSPEKNPDPVWRGMPIKFRKSLEEVWAALLEKMDPEVWDRSFALGRRLARVLKEKRDPIIDELWTNAPGFHKSIDKREYGEYYDAAVGWLDLTVNSDISTLARARKLDFRSYVIDHAQKTSRQNDVVQRVSQKIVLGAGGVPIVGSRLVNAQVVSIRQDGDNAARAQFKPALGPTFELDFARYDGEWYIKQVGDVLESKLPAAKTYLKGLAPEAIKAYKPQFLAAVNTADTALVRLGKTKTAAELKQAGPEVLQSLRGLVDELMLAW